MHTANKKPPRERIAVVVDAALDEITKERDEAIDRFDRLKKAHDALKVQNAELTQQLQRALVARDGDENGQKDPQA